MHGALATRSNGAPQGSGVDRRNEDGERSTARRWGGLFLVAVLVRVAYWVLVTPDWVPIADADQYIQISRNLAEGDGYSLIYPQMELHPTAFRPPLLPLLLTPGAWLFENALWPARVLNLLVGSAVVVLAGAYTARLAGRRAGTVAALVVALYPPLLANDTVSLTEPYALALGLCALLAVQDRRWAWAGVATGLLLLARPNGYVFALLVAAWLLAMVGWRRAAGFSAVVLVIVLPWFIRNQQQVGTFRMVTSDGFTAAAIYAPQSQTVGHFTDPVFSPLFDDPALRLSQFDEADWNDRLLDLAWKGVEDDPGYVLTTVRHNARGYFELKPSLNEWPERNDGREDGFRDATLWLFYVVTVLGLTGLVVRWRECRPWLLTLVSLQYVALSLLLVAPPRLRAPFDLLCCIGIGLLFREPPTEQDPDRDETDAVAADIAGA